MKIFRKRTEQKPVVDTSNLSTNEKRAIALEKARAKRIEKKESGEEEKKRNLREVWEDDKVSLRKSVNAKCFDCCGEENPRNRIRFCTIFNCPLWHVRPYSSGITEEQCRAYTED